MLIPVTEFPATKEYVDLFNKIYLWAESQQFNPIVRTPSGGISYRKPNFRLPCYDIQMHNSTITITILHRRMWRICFRYKADKDDSDGSYFNWWKKYLEICKKHGINLNDYAIEDGKQVNSTIEKYLIKLEHKLDVNRIFTNVNHLDFHSSFPAGLINTHPEFEQVERWLYERRKQHPEYKLALNASIGKFHSDLVSYKWAHLAKDAIEDNNKRVLDIAERLRAAGRRVLLYNTDGIWYQGDPYHGEGEGSDIGQWENDHINCTLRIKSKGAYEYIEDGKYYPVLRGTTDYDLIKSRNEWQWGDIYRDDANPIKYKFIPGTGIVRVGGDENEI